MNSDVTKNEVMKKNIMLIVLIAVLMVTATGATFAYFAFGATSTNAITGTAATASIEFRTSSTAGENSGIPSLIAPTNSTYTSLAMVPQKAYAGTNGATNVLQKALTGASGKDKCVDANGNVICRAYTFTITNMSTATAIVKGQIKFAWSSGGTFANLKWKLMTNATTVVAASGNAGAAATTSFQVFDSNVSLTPAGTANEKKQYWLIVWIEETGGTQNSVDKGSWYGTIEFLSSDGTGITSTITS